MRGVSGNAFRTSVHSTLRKCHVVVNLLEDMLNFLLITADCQCRLGTAPETTKNENLFSTAPPGALHYDHTF